MQQDTSDLSGHGQGAPTGGDPPVPGAPQGDAVASTRGVRKRKRRIVLVDDDRIVLEGLKSLFELEDSVEVCGKATSAEEALEVVRRTLPDAVVVDLILGEGPDGIQLTRALKSMFPTMPALMLSGHDESLFADRALSGGASGYLMKDESTDALFGATERVLEGGVWLSELVWRQLGEPARRAPVVDLSPDERRILAEVRRGNRTHHGIAAALSVSERVVDDLLRRLLERLGLNTVVDLALYAELHDVRRPDGEPPPRV